MSDRSAPGYQIFTDATADFSSSMLQGLPKVEVIPMEVTVGDASFLYGLDSRLTARQFYAMQRGGKYALTSQINPLAYRKAFEATLKAGNDILYLGFSSGMSNCYGNALLCVEELRAEYPGRRIFCPDTCNASIGEAFLVREALRKQAEGMPLDQLAAWVDEQKLKVCHWFAVDTLDHLKHGGRISATAAAVGGILNIKPLLHVDGAGVLGVVKKPRGRNKVIRELTERIQKGWQMEISPLVVIGHGDDAEAANRLKQAIAGIFPAAEIHIAEIGPIIGAHTGPGMLALSYWGDNR